MGAHSLASAICQQIVCRSMRWFEICVEVNAAKCGQIAGQHKHASKRLNAAKCGQIAGQHKHASKRLKRAITHIKILLKIWSYPSKCGIKTVKNRI